MWFLPLISHWEVAARVLIFCGHCFWSAWFALRCKSIFSLTSLTGGHFACSCVHPLNDSSVGASNLMAGNRKLVRKVTVFLKAISLVLWIPYFPTKNILHDKNRTFSTRVFTCRFFSSRFSWPFKDLHTLIPEVFLDFSSRKRSRGSREAATTSRKSDEEREKNLWLP